MNQTQYFPRSKDLGASDQCYASNYPALSMCAVDYKSMMGGYRTLLVMNLVNHC